MEFSSVKLLLPSYRACFHIYITYDVSYDVPVRDMMNTYCKLSRLTSVFTMVSGEKYSTLNRNVIIYFVN